VPVISQHAVRICQPGKGLCVILVLFSRLLKITGRTKKIVLRALVKKINAKLIRLISRRIGRPAVRQERFLLRRQVKRKRGYDTAGNKVLNDKNVRRFFIKGFGP
jgi:hypothetical protein